MLSPLLPPAAAPLPACQVLITALRTLNERHGSSLPAIKKWLKQPLPAANNMLALKNALKLYADRRLEPQD